MLDGHERGAADGRLGGQRARLGVIVALFHDAGYIRKNTDAEQHGAQYGIGGPAGSDLYFDLQPGYYVRDVAGELFPVLDNPAGNHGR